MGLSNEERTRKIVYGINNIFHECKEGLKYLKQYPHDYPPVKPLFKKGITLWRNLLNKKGNSAFWILGSDETVGFSNTSLFSIAVYDNIKTTDTTVINKRKENEIDYEFFSKRLNIEGFLSTKNIHVYNIYYLCQHIQYATNRYQDEFAQSHITLLNQISDMMGLIFDIFSKDSDYAKAWLWKEICERLYGKGWTFKTLDTLDDLTKFMHDTNIHHKFTINTDLSLLKKALKSLVEDQSNRNRLKWIITLGGNEFDSNKIKILCKKYKFPWIAAAKILDKRKKINDVKDSSYSKEFEKDQKFNMEDLLGIEHKYE